MTNEEIINKSGVHPSECNCIKCKSMCRTPCIGTPEDVEKLIDAGYQDKLTNYNWLVGMMIGTHTEPVIIIAPKTNEATGYCVFNCNGLCELHDKGLKPLEGKLAHHSSNPMSFAERKNHHLLLIIESWEEIKELLQTKS